MIVSPVHIALICLLISVIVIFGLLIRLVRANAKLKRELLALTGVVNANSKDIAGLCSAAVTVDGRLTNTGSQLHQLYDQIEQYQQQVELQVEQSAHPYSGDIRKVRSGASVDELMQSSGLTHDEAALLIRLHGANSQR